MAPQYLPLAIAKQTKHLQLVIDKVREYVIMALLLGRDAHTGVAARMPRIFFRMNTSKSVSKQRTSSPFRMNTYEKQGRGAPVLLNQQSSKEFLHQPRIRTPPISLPSHHHHSPAR